MLRGVENVVRDSYITSITITDEIIITFLWFHWVMTSAKLATSNVSYMLEMT